MQKERAEQLISSLGYKLGYSLCTPVFKFCANCLLKLIILRHGHKLASDSISLWPRLVCTSS